MTRATLLTLVCSAALAASGCKPAEPELIPTTNAEHNQVLGTLGFDTGLGPRLDGQGHQVPDGYHPLLKRNATFHPRAELYLGGYTIGAGKEFLFDDATAAYAALPLTSKTDTSWTGAQFKNGVAGDFDGDGLQELFIVYYAGASQTLRYLLLDVNGATLKEGDLEVGVPATNLDERVSPSLAAGDFDGDGKDEVAVGFGRFYLVDALDSDPTVAIRTRPNQAADDCFVALGNLDWDAADELVVTYTTTSGSATIGRYAIYDGTFDTPTQEGPLTFTVGSTSHSARHTRVAIGDVDRDRLGEIVFGGVMEDASWGVFALEYERPGKAPLYDWKNGVYLTIPTSWLTWEVPRPFFLMDSDGDGTKELFMQNRLFRLNLATPTQEVVVLGGLNWLHRAAAGDVDGDGRDDLIFENGAVTARGLNSLDVWQDKKTWSGTPTHAVSTIIVAANVDTDSAVVRYNDEHELLFTRPQLLAVLASPPYIEGQNRDGTVSTYGTTVGQTVEHTTSLGFKTGFSVGYEADFGIFGGAEFTASVETSLDITSGHSVTVEKDSSFSTGSGEDKVVFTTVPFDVYYYTIVSSPDVRDVGRRVSINVPREPQVQAATLEYYNGHNGGGLDVDSQILKHTPGKVWSYPTVSDRNRLLDQAQAQEPTYQPLWNGPQAITQGTGNRGIGISTTQGSSRAASMGFSVEFEFTSTAPGGAKFGTSVGFQYGHSCTYSTEATAYFQGTVSDLSAAAYGDPANHYQYGLFVYPQTLSGQRFLVMNYWTQQ